MCRKIISPSQIKTKLWLTTQQREQIKTWREEIKNIILKKSNKLLVIAGPCSIHNIDEWLDYAKKLKEISQKYENLFVVMRAYFEKPRTSIGWKGLIQDPDLNCTNHIEKWLFQARNFLLELMKIGLPAATELLEPLQVVYYEDLISYGAIWARTTESQVHREMVSALDFPVGFKNSTDGSVKNAINSIVSASKSHSFLSIDENWQVCQKNSKWNQYTNIILRWEEKWPNYDENSVGEVVEQLKQNNIETWIIIDASHGNSFKKAENQIKVIESISHQKNKNIVWVMIESNINFGNQKFDPCKDDKNNLKYGVSITDECVSLQQTDKILEKLNNLF